MMSSGCPGTTEIPPAESPSARSEFNPYQEIKAADIQTFLNVLGSLPEGKMPDLNLSAAIGASRQQSPVDYVASYRRSLHERLNPNLLARGWEQNSNLQAAVTKAGWSMQDFSELTLRISLAFMHQALSQKIDFLKTKQEGDRLIEETLMKFKQLDDAKYPATDPNVIRERDILNLRLEHAIALSYFGELLSGVPSISSQRVRPVAEQLQRYFPDPNKQVPQS
jgi:hypothetical protein